MDKRKNIFESYEWVKIPEDLPRKNLVLVTAKTTESTIHPEDPEYSVRVFKAKEMYEAARSLAQRPVGLNHLAIINEAYTVDANWNDKEQAVEALLYLPDAYINRIRDNKIKKVSVEFTWRDEIRTPNGVEFEGIVFNRVDLLENMNPGDKATQIKLVEGKRGLMEGDIQQTNIQSSIDDPSDTFFKECMMESITLGEPLSSDFKKVHDKMVAQYGPEKGNDVYYAWVNKHGYDDKKAFPKKEADIAVINEEKQLIPLPKEKEVDGKLVFNEIKKDDIKEVKEASVISMIPGVEIREANLTGKKKQVPEVPVNPMANEPVAPMTPQVLTDKQPEQSVNMIGVVGNENKTKECDKVIMSEVKVESKPEEKKPEVKKEEVKQEVKQATAASQSVTVNVVTPTSTSSTTTVTTPTIQTPIQTPEVAKIVEAPKTVETIKIESPIAEIKEMQQVIQQKDTRVKELEGVVAKLQENAKATDKDKKEAVDKAKKEIIEKVKSVLPSEDVVQNFNRGAKVLADDIKRVIYESKDEK